ncbi:MAG: hypothetical protein IAF58_13740 [Leptolyngbya sp.]|nr:hypothetical protein [Candidatus Melainabacteria bacterium]
MNTSQQISELPDLKANLEFLLFVGTAHDRPLRIAVAERAKALGFEVLDLDGPFGSVMVDCPEARISELVSIPEVTSICQVPSEEEIDNFLESMEMIAVRRCNSPTLAQVHPSGVFPCVLN